MSVMPSVFLPSLSSSTPTTRSKSAQKRAIRDAQARALSAESEKWTPFRTAEKHYMARVPGVRPDLKDALDLALLDTGRKEECEHGGWVGSLGSVRYRQIRFGGMEGRLRAYVLPDVPGLVVLPGFLSHDEQRTMVRWALHDHARPPNETNLDTHYLLPACGLWLTALNYSTSSQLILPRASAEPASSIPPPSAQSARRTLISNEPASPTSFASLAATPKLPAPPSASLSPASASELVKKLRWANLGWYYHWGTKQYDFTRPKVPIDDRVATTCKQAVQGVNWEEVFDGTEGEWPEGDTGSKGWSDDYEPDAGIVNYYQKKDTLMAHVDRSEVCATAPLVSISLGLSAIFLIGGTERSTPPTALVLRSGDALIMAGPRCRRAYHGVPRVLEGSLPEHLGIEGNDEEWKPYGEYLAGTRVNVNVRQVFPKGFDPSAHVSSSCPTVHS